MLSTIRQFDKYKITHEKANKTSAKYRKTDEYGEFVQCYFHMFESSGEHAWKMLGLTNVIVSESELDELENKLRDRLQNLSSKRE